MFIHISYKLIANDMYIQKHIKSFQINIYIYRVYSSLYSIFILYTEIYLYINTYIHI